MGLARGLFRALIIVLLLNLIDTIICVLWPLFTGSLHIFPSMRDTCAIVLAAPMMFSTHMHMSLRTVRAILLIVGLCILAGVLSESHIKAILSYEGLIMLLVILLAFMNAYYAINPGSLEVSILIAGAASELLMDPLHVLIVLLYHAPLAMLSCLIHVCIRKYREFLEEMRILKIGRRPRA